MRFHGTGKDGHTFKILGETESVKAMSYRNGAGTGFTECFGVGEGYLRLKNTATASLPASPDEGALVYDTDDNKPKFYNGSSWTEVGTTETTGSWTPVLLDTSKNTDENQTYAVQSGDYTRIGNRIFFDCDLQMTSLGNLSGSVVYVGGLPAAMASGATPASVTVSQVTNASITATESIGGYIEAGNSEILLTIWNDSGGTALLPTGDLTNDFLIRLSGNYPV